ncbi:MAG TPA: DNA starvation/stationary phase protection protein Dps [Gemmatirosa sp.]
MATATIDTDSKNASKQDNKAAKHDGNGKAPSRPVEPTRNDLPADTRGKMIQLCNLRLADCIDLQTQTKQAHWNVRGPHFWGLHKLFDKINEAVEEYVDLIAERAAQLGGEVEGTARMVAGRSTLPEYPKGILGGIDSVKALSTALASFGKVAREAIDASDEAEDADTSDMFTEISRGIDQWLWFVEAHLQADN